MSRIPPELEAEMTPAVKAAFLVLLDRIDELEAQLQKLTPRNSSIPPSTEHPHAKPKRKKPTGKKRKRGGQKGHDRHLRKLVPTEQCTTVTECFPEACRRCGGELQQVADAPQRHQVWELPPILPIIDEYQLFRGLRWTPDFGRPDKVELPGREAPYQEQDAGHGTRPGLEHAGRDI